MEAVAFSYDGDATLVATITGATVGQEYALVGTSAVSDTAVSSTLVLTGTVSGIAAGTTFEAWVQRGPAFTLGSDYIAATVFTFQGGTDEFFFDDPVWDYDGDGTVTVTFTSSPGVDYFAQILDVALGGSSHPDVVGDGTAKTLTVLDNAGAGPAQPATGDYFYAVIYTFNDDGYQGLANRLFEAGTAGAGFPGPGGGAEAGGGGGTGVLRFGDPPLWRLIVTNLAGEVLTTLDKRSRDRSFEFTLNEPAMHTGVVPADDPEINIPSPDATSPAFLSNNSRLVFGLRREVRPTPSDDPWHCRYSGIVMQVEDVAADQPSSRYTAFDSWKYLFSRPVRGNDGALAGADGLVYTDERASVMAYDLLANTIAADGDVFIDASDTSLITDTDVIPGDTVFDRGLSVGEAWQQLCETGTIDIILNPIYDPEGRPGKLCELIIVPRAGETRFNAVMGWDRASRSITDMSRMIDGTRLANVVQMYAGQGGAPVTPQSDAGSIAEFGAYWAQQFVVGKDGQAQLVELMALAQLLERRFGPRNIEFAPAPERSYLALRDYALGDYVPVWSTRSLRSPIGVDYDSYDADAPGGAGYQRILSIPITLDDDGVERVERLTTSESSGSVDPAVAAAGGGPATAPLEVVVTGSGVSGGTLTAVATGGS